jgi:hypothetical protein
MKGFKFWQMLLPRGSQLRASSQRGDRLLTPGSKDRKIEPAPLFADRQSAEAKNITRNKRKIIDFLIILQAEAAGPGIPFEINGLEEPRSMAAGMSRFMLAACKRAP